MTSNTIFFKPKDKRLANKISIETPAKFRNSIRELSKHGLTLKEHKALVLARTRAKLHLRRKNLSGRERNQMKEIAKTRIPKISKR